MKCDCRDGVTESALLRQIAECEFTLIDINLFLDTHPDDRQAIADFNCYAEQLRALKHRYAEEFGPMDGFGNAPNYVSETDFAWVCGPWPWQRMGV